MKGIVGSGAHLSGKYQSPFFCTLSFLFYIHNSLLHLLLQMRCFRGNVSLGHRKSLRKVALQLLHHCGLSSSINNRNMSQFVFLFPLSSTATCSYGFLSRSCCFTLIQEVAPASSITSCYCQHCLLGCHSKCVLDGVFDRPQSQGQVGTIILTVEWTKCKVRQGSGMLL